ncbi:hypothetical protein JIN85_11360 [Luteolibacter pohnpeiensis]|uniref:ABC transporter permease n=1 Tax=Luteolibacter pohnpeiensis TaxID=454153 RepID=A0A934S5L6_9BACT|nr:hypothetical protein [Luteolibacter pohnpeiensis]MBK1883016.1 hypothetical protein [Luteolibacter pohnpeiensis]
MKGYQSSHLYRISVIARHTFTQLVRMKVFYFLAVFAVIALASNFFDLPQHETPESLGINVLRSIKSWSIGTMTLFSVVLSVVATALLLPKDVEDRTLYTVLAKPVPRFDYLAGKLGGVLLLIFSSLVLMDILMTAVLHVRSGIVMNQQMELATAQGWPQDAINAMLNDTVAQGVTWSLQGAVIAIFIRSAIIASIALLVSTFSTSTLFTTIVSFLIYFIGNFQADALDAFLKTSETLQKVVTGLVSLILPNFQLFNVIDAVIEGQIMPLMVLVKLVLLGLFYAGFYTLASWFIFSDKEF